MRDSAGRVVRTYSFTALGRTSPVGSTRTAPAPGAANTRLRFGMVSGSNYTGGFFSAYRHLADREDLDFVVPATEMVTLSDYRRRHALDKADVDLARLHARYAFITTWDDHEVTDDAWREGADVPRRNRSHQAYDEWMPIRLPQTRSAEETRIYRRLQFGTVADLTMLDLGSTATSRPVPRTARPSTTRTAR